MSRAVDCVAGGVVLALSACLLGATLGADRPAQTPATPSPSTTSGALIGRVVDAETGSGISDATIRLSNVRLVDGAPQQLTQAPLPVLTGAEGWFLIRGVKPGTYSGVTAEAPGYLVSGTSQLIDVSPDGPKWPGIELRLARPAAISGVVRDEHGEPVAEIRIRVFQVEFDGGRSVLSPRGYGRTDDRGMYRVFGLRPGRYVVAALGTQLSLPRSTAEQYQDALKISQDKGREFLGGLEAMTSANAPLATDRGITRGDAIVVTSRPDWRLPLPGDPELAYRTTYSPLGATASAADVIDIRSGEERNGVDVTLRGVPAHRVTGSVVDAEGPVKNLPVRLVPDSAQVAGVSGLETAITLTDHLGRFAFPQVPSGSYVITAHVVPPTPYSDGLLTIADIQGVRGTLVTDARGISQPPPLPRGPIRWLSHSVAVNDGDIDVSLTLQTGFRVAGQITLEGSGVPLPSAERLSQIQLSIEPSATSYLQLSAASRRGRVSGDGTFETVAVPAGRYLLHLNFLPPGWTVKSIRIGSQEALEQPVSIERDVTNVTAVLANQRTVVSGRTTWSSGTERAHAVLMFPTDQALWKAAGSSKRFRVARTSADGDYDFPDVAPGDYLLVALTDVTDDWRSPQLLSVLAPNATRVTLAAGTAVVKHLDARPVQVPASVSLTATVSSEPLQVETPAVIVTDGTHLPIGPPAGRGGTGVIEGRIVGGSTPGAALRNALVKVTGERFSLEEVAATDAEGRFRITGLAPGVYTVSATKPGFVETWFGASAPGRRPGTPIGITNERPAMVELRLPASAAISGTVRNIRGVPLPDVTVRVLERRLVQGVERMYFMQGTSVEGRTDDRGNYRVYGLLAGQYLMIAIPSANARDGAYRPGAGYAAWFQSLRTAASTPPVGNDTLIAQAPVLFPGTTEFAAAEYISVGEADERTNADIRLDSVPLGTVSGRIDDGSGRPPESIRLSLTQANVPPALRSVMNIGSTRVNPDATFQVTGLAPGRYKLSAQGVRARTASTTPRDRPVMWADLDFTFGGRDMENLSVMLREGATISGHLAFVGDPPDKSQYPDIRIAARRADDENVPATVAIPDAEGHFRLSGMRPGTYLLGASLTGSLASSRRWALSSANVRGIDALDRPFAVEQDVIAGATVTLTTAVSELSGRVTDSTGRAMSGYAVIVVPEERRLWLPQSWRLPSPVLLSTDGRYRIRGLPPGSYRLALVSASDRGQWPNIDVLEGVVAAGVPIVLRDGQVTTRDFRIDSPPR